MDHKSLSSELYIQMQLDWEVAKLLARAVNGTCTHNWRLIAQNICDIWERMHTHYMNNGERKQWMELCNLELWTNNCTTLVLVFITSNYRTLSNYFDHISNWLDAIFLSFALFVYIIKIFLPFSVTGTKHIMCIRSCLSENWSVFLSHHRAVSCGFIPNIYNCYYYYDDCYYL